MQGDLLEREDADDVLELLDDGPMSEPARQVWRLLVVDDDEDVHDATRFALQGVTVLGRPLQLLHARSAAEARATLAHERDVAVILLDVVMESERAGLDLVREIRGALGQTDVRIVLRTGQPGYAPELSTIRDYDVNDYKTKSELTQARLFATLTTSIRSYSQLQTIRASRRGLSLVVRGTAALFGIHGLRDMAEGVIVQIAGLLGVDAEGVVCLRATDDGELRVIAGAGRFRERIGEVLSPELDPRVAAAVDRALVSGHNEYGDGWAAMPFESHHNARLIAFVSSDRHIDELTQDLIEVFCSNIAVCFENVELVSRLREAAYFDALCGVRNRAGLVQQIDEALGRRADGAAGTLALLDINQFAEINDALGHRYGDRLLQSVASRLRDRVGELAVVGRVSGDVFGVLGPDERVRPEALRNALRESFVVDGDEVELGVSMGFVRLSDVDGDGSDALKEASIALQRSKQRPDEPDAYFSRAFATEIEERVSLLRSLRVAMARDEFFLVFQPQFALDTGRVVGFEALLRWSCAERGFISPDRFIPIAERSGLIVPIGAWVLLESARMLARLDAQGFAGLRMSANVALSQFRHPTFAASLEAALDACAAPSRFELEITESMAMDDPALLREKLSAAKARGCTIAIDDFGTGYSSLSHLHRLPVDRLKIDRAFVNALSDPSAGSRIADSVVKLGAGLGLSVIAEGIETEPQREALASMGCHEGQGFLFARPMREDALLAWLRARSGA